MRLPASRLPALLAPVLAGALPASATAAEVTDLPPRFRGDLHLRYDGRFRQVGLEEEDTTVALRNDVQHDVVLRGEVAVHTGVAVTLGLPITAAHAIDWPAARQMVFEPLLGRGSFLEGPALPEADRPEVRGSGVQGVWIGVAASPFRRTYERGYPVDTRFDVAFRTPAPGGTLYGEKRGGAPGGWGVLLQGAFSTRQGRTEPYAVFAWQHETGVEVDVLYPDGTTAENVRVDPADRLDVRLGGELIAVERPDLRFAFDLWTGFGYVGPEDYPAGFWLPDALPATRGVSVARSEYLQFRAGLALDFDIGRHVGLRFGTEGRYFTPHRVEHPYEVRTDPLSYEVTWTAGIVGRIRLKGDPDVASAAQRSPAKSASRSSNRW